jgi:hypothetical protein
MFGDPQAKDAGLGQPADIAERAAAFEAAGGSGRPMPAKSSPGLSFTTW